MRPFHSRIFLDLLIRISTLNSHPRIWQNLSDAWCHAHFEPSAQYITWHALLLVMYGSCHYLYVPQRKMCVLNLASILLCYMSRTCPPSPKRTIMTLYNLEPIIGDPCILWAIIPAQKLLDDSKIGSGCITCSNRFRRYSEQRIIRNICSCIIACFDKYMYIIAWFYLGTSKLRLRLRQNVATWLMIETSYFVVETHSLSWRLAVPSIAQSSWVHSVQG